MPTLVPSLQKLRAEINTRFPERDKASDGWIGDPAHQLRHSDHNPDSRGIVHAVDVDSDLGAGWLSMQGLVGHIVDRCRTGEEKRLTYVIYLRRIWTASNRWTPAPYGGTNPHDKHAHFSGSAERAREADVSPWLEDLMTPQDKKDIILGVADEVMKRLRTQPGKLLSDQTFGHIGDAVWNHQEPDPAGGAARRVGGDMRQLEFRRGLMEGRIIKLLTDEAGQQHAKLDEVLALLRSGA